MILKGGPNICGVTIGVLCLDSSFPKPPGHIKNPSGLDFPVLYETVKGASVAELIKRPSVEFIKPFIKAAQRLEAEGVRAITGSCGFLALYQRQLADAVSVPVFASSLIQVAMVYHMLGAEKQVGILTASAPDLTQQHLQAVGVDNIPVAIAGMEAYDEFRQVILEGQRSDMDIVKIEQEVLSAAKQLVDAHPNVGAIILECTDMPPYAYAIQQLTGLPVFDLTTLTTMVYHAVTRNVYQGIMPGVS